MPITVYMQVYMQNNGIYNILIVYPPKHIYMNFPTFTVPYDCLLWCNIVHSYFTKAIMYNSNEIIHKYKGLLVITVYIIIIV